MKVIITGGKSATALKLAKAFAGHEILFADYGEVPTLSTSSYQFVSLGQRNDDITAHHLLSFCLDNQVDALLPLCIFELHPLAKSATLFHEFGIKLLLPPVETLPNYLGAVRSADIAVFLDGDLLYATQPVPQAQMANGAYYILQGEKPLQLITI